MKTRWRKWHLIICLFALMLLLLPPTDAWAAKPGKAPQGIVSIVIDPMKNTLTVLSDGIPFKKYPIALGKPETPTPVGEWVVINKHKDWEVWFGTRWIGLNVPWGFYGIHGTNKPGSIGSDASHGCVRMFNRDVEQLYEWVQTGTRVSILGHALREPHLTPRRLAAGDSGVDVMLIQNRLRGAGFYHGTCNGKFGIVTENAMKAFEKAHGLQIDGVVGLHDYYALGLLE